MGGLHGGGIIALKSAFKRSWVERLREGIDMLLSETLQRPGGALKRGPNRYYVEVHPERIRGFADLITHPSVTQVCAAVLGPDYWIAEAEFDVPGPGARAQPWHRDFPSPNQIPGWKNPVQCRTRHACIEASIESDRGVL